MKKGFILIVLLLLLVGCGEKKESPSTNNANNTVTDSSTTETNKNLYCEEGTLKDGKCEIVLTAEGTSKCESGYTLKDGKCTKTENVNAKATKTCDKDYTLSGSTCVSTKTYDKVTTKKCVLPAKYDIGEYENIDGKKTTNSAYVKDGECWYNACTHWYDGKCDGGEFNRTEYTTITSCPSGTKEISGKCKKTATPKTTYSCEDGTLNKNKCTVTKEIDPTVTCENEYTYNNETKQCEKINIVEAQEK